jgi:hypothetical protein
MNGTVTKYDGQKGRGELTLVNGQVIKFTWDQVETPPTSHPSWATNSPVGSGYTPSVGQAVVYDHNDTSRPVRIVWS